jgi:hypothetical protein
LDRALLVGRARPCAHYARPVLSAREVPDGRPNDFFSVPKIFCELLDKHIPRRSRGSKSPGLCRWVLSASPPVRVPRCLCIHGNAGPTRTHGWDRRVRSQGSDPRIRDPTKAFNSARGTYIFVASGRAVAPRLEGPLRQESWIAQVVSFGESVADLQECREGNDCQHSCPTSPS